MDRLDELIAATSHRKIKSLVTSGFASEDIVNLILQRSEIIGDQPRAGRAINAWAQGNEQPLLDIVSRLGDTLVRRAAASILLEYLQLEPTLAKIAPKSVADIGCGYAIFDLFVWQDFQSTLTLIDIETTSERHFGFRKTGAAYTNLATAKSFLIENGVPEADVTLRNPNTDDLSQDAPCDLAVSFFSCGFHYPVQTYLDFFRTNIAERGSVILDLRTKRADPAIRALEDLGDVSVIADAARGSAQRVHLQKQAGK